MQCPSCHREVSASGPQPPAFCTFCGAPLAAASAPPPAATAPPTASAYVPPPVPDAPPASPYVPPPAAAAPGLTHNSAAAVAYLTFIPAVIFLLIEPYNKIPLVRFHSMQSIGLNVVAFAIYIILHIIMVPFGFLLYEMVHALVTLALFVVWLIAIVNAGKGAWFKLPVIGDFALRQSQG